MRTSKSFIKCKCPIFFVFSLLLLSVYKMFSTVKINKSTYGNSEQKCLPLGTVMMNTCVFALSFFCIYMPSVSMQTLFVCLFFLIIGLYLDNVLPASVEG